MALIDRSGAEAIIPEAVSNEILQNVPERSAIMRLGRRLPNMPVSQLRMPVLSAMVQAYFVDGEPTAGSATAGVDGTSAYSVTPGEGYKQTTQAAWANKYINAGEMATIVPIPESILDEAQYDIWGEIRPRIEEALGGLFDAAVLYGTNAPSNWPDGIVVGAAAAGNTVAIGDVVTTLPDATERTDVYNDIFAEGGLIEAVEEDGYDVTGHIAALRMRSRLRGLRDDNGQPVFYNLVREGGRYQLDGTDIEFPRNGAVDPAASLLISGDYDQLVWSVRQDITYKMLDQAVIQNPDGSIMFNLAQQNMVALRCTFRAGWQIPNPLNRLNTNEATRYPFAVLTP